MTRDEFARLCASKTVILDGATGSNLIARGMPRGVCTEQWVSENPQILLQLQREYVAAGSDIIYASTFSANRYSLARAGLQDQVEELNTKLVRLSKEAADGKALVAGDMTTTGVPLEPDGTMEYGTLFEIYSEQADALARAGADLLVVETMLGVEETTVALEAAHEVCDLPVMCSLSVEADGSAYFGGNCVDAIEVLQELGADAAGINCSCGPEQLVSLTRNMKQIAAIPLLIKPNAGMPMISDQGEAIYPMGPEEFAEHMMRLVDAGANLIGGCCGTSPEFIAALKNRI